MEFLKIWEILRRRRWIIIGIFLIFSATVIIGTKQLTPIYQARAKVLIEDSTAQESLLTILGLQGVGQQGNLPARSSDNPYATDIELAKIKPLLDGLISSLQLHNKDGELMGPEELTDWGLSRYISPQPYVEVNQYEDADILEIVSYSSDPQEAADMANILAESYIRDRLDRVKENYGTARVFIENKIQNVKEEYYKALSELKDFKLKTGVTDVKLELQRLNNRLADLNKLYEDNEKSISELEKTINEAQSMLSKTDMFRKATKEFSLNDQIKTLKNKLNELLVNVAEKSVDFTREHPEYQKLEKEIEKVKELLKVEAEVVFSRETFSVNPIYDELINKLVNASIDKEAALMKRIILKKFIDKYEDSLRKLTRDSAEISKLELTLGVKKDMYQRLLQYLSQISIAESMTLSKLKLVERATKPDEDKPFFPAKMLNYILGIILGLFWALVIAFFVEYIDNTIKSPNDLKRIASLTLLGTLPKSKYLKRRQIISNINPTLSIVERFRKMKNNILYVSVDKPLKCIAITSSTVLEGKSSFASNIAITFSMEGRRVLLIDLNLRKPDIHRFFNISNSIGITNILTKESKLEDAIVENVYEGLDLLPSGPVPPDPGKLIESQRLKEIISTLNERYDVVVIDTPAAAGLNDAIVIGGIADGVILINESGKVTFSMFEYVKENMVKANVDIIGVILNKFKGYFRGYYKN